MEPASRYQILNAVGMGSFATVYRARDRKLGREVAVKQIHQQFLQHPRQLKRYWQQAQLLASLQHPNMLTIHQILQPQGWLILELMRGSLRASGKGEPIDLDYLRSVLVCCLHALEFLHANGVIHGDVKPSNIMIDLRGRIKLGDFGLARRATDAAGGLLKGTAKYMAPELLSGQFGRPGPASDLYSLGISAYELMCGRRFESLLPELTSFGADKQRAWSTWHTAANCKLPDVSKVLEDIPADLARVVQNLVAKDQTHRYQSAEAVLRHLKAQQVRIIGAKEKGPDAETAEAEKAKRNRRLRVLMISAAAALVVLAMVVGALKIAGRPSRPEPIVQQQPESTEGIVASRPEIHEGRIASIEADGGKITLALALQDGQLVVKVPALAKIVFNGKEEIDGRPPAPADLRVDDRVVVRHVANGAGRRATHLEAERVVTTEGTVRQVDSTKGELTLATEAGDGHKLVVLQFDPKCQITINQQKQWEGQLLKPEDLKPGDKASVAHDTQVVRVDAYRIVRQAGVIQKVDYSANALEVLIEGQQRAADFLVGPQSRITLAGQPVELADLRTGDMVDITHDWPGSENPEALTVAATRPPDPSRWAILVGIQDYEDISLSPLDYPVADAKLLEETLVGRYRVPAGQTLLLVDASRAHLEQDIVGLLDRAGPEDQMIVYFAGHAYRDQEGRIYLAPRDFDLSNLSVSGLSLEWLVDQLEQCAAKQKLLLLDCSNVGAGADLKIQPSTAEMLQTLEAPSGRTRLQTVTAIASSSKGQRGYAWPEVKHGIFAYSLSQGFSGRADTNRDSRLETTELFAFLEQTMQSAGAQIHRVQTPRLFLPDTGSRRLSDDAKKSIRKLAAYLAEDRIEMFEVNLEYSIAEELAGEELQPKLLYGLLLLKTGQRDQASRIFQQIRAADPDQLPALQGLAWLQFEKGLCADGVEALAGLVCKVPKSEEPTGPCPKEAGQVFQWAGQLREFAAGAVPETFRAPGSTLQKLDAAIAAHGSEAQQLYEQGRTQTRGDIAEFDKRIEAGDEATKSKLRVQRRQLSRYASFPFNEAAQEILARLDQ